MVHLLQTSDCIRAVTRRISKLLWKCLSRLIDSDMTYQTFVYILCYYNVMNRYVLNYLENKQAHTSCKSPWQLAVDSHQWLLHGEHFWVVHRDPGSDARSDQRGPYCTTPSSRMYFFEIWSFCSIQFILFISYHLRFKLSEICDLFLYTIRDLEFYAKLEKCI